MTACFQCIRDSFADALVAASHHVDCSRDFTLTNPSSLTGAITPILAASASNRARHHIERTAQETAGICRHDERYPQKLATDPSSPPVVWLIGKRERLRQIDHQPASAVIGPRHSAHPKQAIADSALDQLVKTPALLVTTLRPGIDSTVARAATKFTTTLLAITAGAPAIPYPSSQKRLHHEIATEHAVISVTPPSAPPPLSTAHAECRLQLRLIDALLAIETPEHPPPDSRLAFTFEAASLRQIKPIRLTLRSDSDPAHARRSQPRPPDP